MSPVSLALLAGRAGRAWGTTESGGEGPTAECEGRGPCLRARTRPDLGRVAQAGGGAEYGGRDTLGKWRAIGFSVSYCRRMRAEHHVPHERHWPAIRALTEG
jgi:hypothetical protein